MPDGHHNLRVHNPRGLGWLAGMILSFAGLIVSMTYVSSLRGLSRFEFRHMFNDWAMWGVGLVIVALVIGRLLPMRAYAGDGGALALRSFLAALAVGALGTVAAIAAVL